MAIYDHLYILLPVALFIFSYAGIILLSQHLDRNDYKTHFGRFLQPCLLLALLLYFANGSLSLQAVLLAAVQGVIISFTFPSLYHYTHHGEPDEYSFPVDFSCGLFSVCLLVAAGIILYSLFPPLPAAAVLTILELTLLFPSVFHIAYAVYYGGCIDEMAIKALLETYMLEIKEYVRLIPKRTLLLFLAALVFSVTCIFAINASIVPVNGGSLYLPFFIGALILFLLFG